MERIAEVVGIEGQTPQMQDIFLFRATGEPTIASLEISKARESYLASSKNSPVAAYRRLTETGSGDRPDVAVPRSSLLILASAVLVLYWVRAARRETVRRRLDDQPEERVEELPEPPFASRHRWIPLIFAAFITAVLPC